MKGSEQFKQTIKAHLESMRQNNELFTDKFSNPNKNIDDCITYILNTVKNSGINGFTDDEIFSMAIHYYEEEDIKVGSPVNCSVVVNHTVELTEEEKKAAKDAAIKKAQDEAFAAMTKKHKSVAKIETQQGSLF